MSIDPRRPAARLAAAAAGLTLTVAVAAVAQEPKAGDQPAQAPKGEAKKVEAARDLKKSVGRLFGALGGKADGEEKPAEVADEAVEVQAVVEVIAVPAMRILPAGAAPAVAEEKDEAGDDEEKLDPEAAQYVQQFEPLMRSEIYLVRKVCELDPAQRTKLNALGRRAVRRAAKAFVQDMRRPRQMNESAPDAYDLFAEPFQTLLGPALSPEQLARYKAEREARDRMVRRAFARNMVATMDEDLVLNPEQREVIFDAIVENYDREWAGSLELFHYDRRFLPRLPDNLVIPHLDDRQKAIWSDQQRNRQRIYGFFGSNNFDNTSLLKEPSGEAEEAPAEAAPAPEPVAVPKSE